jgi:hypothetical protein
MTKPTGTDTRLKLNGYGYEFLLIGMSIDMNFYPQLLY